MSFHLPIQTLPNLLQHCATFLFTLSSRTQPASQELETMASSEINIIAIITPHPDKFSIVEELVKDVAAKVHENEPDVLAYQAHVERKRDGSGTIVFVEK